MSRWIWSPSHVQAAIDASGLSVYTIAERVGVGFQAVLHWTGTAKPLKFGPLVTHALTLADVLGVDVRDLCVPP